MKKIAAAVCGSFMLVTTLGACGGGELSAEEFCSEGEKQLEGIEQKPAEAHGIISDLAEQAPSEIQGDFQTFADALEGTESMQDLGKAMTAPDAQKAAENISSWVDKNCSNAG